MPTKNNFKSFITPFPKEIPEVYTPDTRSILNKFNLSGKVAVVTGGAGAIGRAIAEGFAQSGADVVILDLKLTSFSDELSSKYGVKSSSYSLDLSEENQVQNIIAKIVKVFGTIDIFVANAGIAWNKGTILNPEASSREWRAIFDINVHGTYYCAKHVGKVFKSKGKGSLIMTASMSAHIVNIPNYQTCYNASKAAVLHMARSLAVEFAEFARVNSVSPGYTNTPLSDPVPLSERSKWWAMTPRSREANPAELVGAFLYLASDASTFTTGIDIKVDGGYCLL